MEPDPGSAVVVSTNPVEKTIAEGLLALVSVAPAGLGDEAGVLSTPETGIAQRSTFLSSGNNALLCYPAFPGSANRWLVMQRPPCSVAET